MKDILCFDIGDTLVKFTSPKSAYYELASYLRCPEGSIRSYFKDEISRRRMSAQEVSRILCARYPQNDVSESVIQNILIECTPTYKLFEDTLFTLNELKKRGYRLAACSNATFFRTITLSEMKLDDFFCEAVYSFDCGFLKPERDFFRTVENRLGVSSGKLLMIGDSLKSDIYGAVNAGWKAIWLSRAQNTTTYPRQISQLAELLTIFN